ncbi:hypothetical protein HZ992_12265 [Rhizobacter sp. AJA081-3]|uniref:hypothetical protein n=1 Tax=Rhizobacter sp. AJA081-3 TaxID=2753607 RepID=UPI001AE0D1E9|nr:hypothetical protein [Rhizobacter sp. AJA081-3]QTN25673.1 hypothetical protein HZ992_12265 [Rhizobacter sp. AJA081-3]
MLVFLAPSAPLWQAMLEWEQYLARNRIFLEQLLDPATTVGKSKQGPSKAGPRELHLGSNHAYANEWGKGQGTFRNTERQLQQFGDAIDAVQRSIVLLRDAIKNQNDARVLRPGGEKHPAICDIWIDRITRFATTLDDRNYTVYQSGAILDMGIRAVQKAIDAVINRNAPLIALAYYGADHRFFEDDLAGKGGVHYLGMRRGARWLQAPLQVRYALDLDGGVVLRCKLHIPNLQGSKAPWEYDGVLRELRDNLYFVFEKRAKAGGGRKDFFFLVVSASQTPGSKQNVLAGTYLTSDQDDRRTTVSGQAVMWRVSPYADGDEEREKEQAAKMREAWDLDPKADRPNGADVEHMMALLAEYDEASVPAPPAKRARAKVGLKPAQHIRQHPKPRAKGR